MSLVKPRLPPLPTINDILRLYGIRAKKKLSQNFLLDPSLLDRFARMVPIGPLDGKYVVEVGPGPGGITRALIANGAREVHVIEKDPRFMPCLRLLQRASGDVLHINEGDCLNYNMSKLFPEELSRPWLDQDVPDIRLVGNLPFNIASALIVRLMRSISLRENVFKFGRVPMLLTFQHEVADRMIAQPTCTNRSRLSVLCQNWAQVRYKYTLSGGAFQPRPAVNVGVVELIPLKVPYINMPFSFVERVVTALYRDKQKYLKNTVKYLFPEDADQMRNVYALLEMVDLDYKMKPIDLTMHDIEKICIAYKEFCDRDPDIANYLQSDVRKLTLAYQEAKFAGIDDANEVNDGVFDDDPLADLRLDDLEQKELL